MNRDAKGRFCKAEGNKTAKNTCKGNCTGKCKRGNKKVASTKKKPVGEGASILDILTAYFGDKVITADTAPAESHGAALGVCVRPSIISEEEEMQLRRAKKKMEAKYAARDSLMARTDCIAEHLDALVATVEELALNIEAIYEDLEEVRELAASGVDSE